VLKLNIYKSLKIIYVSILLLLTQSYSFSQKSLSEITETDVERPVVKYLTWTMLQTVPSVTWIDDRNESSSSLKFALRWQITPLNISFSTNKYVSPVQFIMVNPMRRYTGSLEFFVQPEWVLSSMENSGYERFGLGVGSRVNIPLKNMGEHLYMSLGGKYNFRKNQVESKEGYYGLEAGVYALFGILGFQFNYNFDENYKYNFGIYLKYW